MKIATLPENDGFTMKNGGWIFSTLTLCEFNGDVYEPAKNISNHFGRISKIGHV